MHEPQAKNWRPLVLIGTALFVWGVLLAIGAYLELGTNSEERDPRKFWVVIGCVTFFLAFWGAALWLRSRRS